MSYIHGSLSGRTANLPKEKRLGSEALLRTLEDIRDSVCDSRVRLDAIKGMTWKDCVYGGF
mgnify:CR=1 FL=1|jgi:hypothetical protein